MIREKISELSKNMKEDHISEMCILYNIIIYTIYNVSNNTYTIYRS